MKPENKKTIIKIVIMLIVIVGVIGLTYALWDMFVVQKDTNKLVGGCFDVKVTDSNPINMEDVEPMSEAEGRATTPYQVTITNQCNTVAKYQINAEILSDTNIPISSMRLAIDDNSSRLMSSAVRVEPTIQFAQASYRHLSTKLAPGETVTHDIRVWMDEKAPFLVQGAETHYVFKITINASAEETPYACEGCGTLKTAVSITNYPYDYYFLNSDTVYRDEIESLKFVDNLDIPSEAISWDVSETRDGSVMAWYTDLDNNSLYEVTIGSVGGVIANPYSRSLFQYLTNIKELSFENFYTDKVENMQEMFYMFGRDVNSLHLDLSNLNTSSVTNMQQIFYDFGRNSPEVTLDLSNFDTSKVTNMSVPNSINSSASG